MPKKSELPVEKRVTAVLALLRKEEPAAQKRQNGRQRQGHKGKDTHDLRGVERSGGTGAYLGSRFG
jgi:hypothetical protein